MKCLWAWLIKWLKNIRQHDLICGFKMLYRLFNLVEKWMRYWQISSNNDKRMIWWYLRNGWTKLDDLCGVLKVRIMPRCHTVGNAAGLGPLNRPRCQSFGNAAGLDPLTLPRCHLIGNAAWFVALERRVDRPIWLRNGWDIIRSVVTMMRERLNDISGMAEPNWMIYAAL